MSTHQTFILVCNSPSSALKPLGHIIFPTGLNFLHHPPLSDRLSHLHAGKLTERRSITIVKVV